MDVDPPLRVRLPSVARPRVRPDSVMRDRVVRAVVSAVDRPLTVMGAPAGYGKTTAVVTALETVGAPIAWLALDASANDGRLFCAQLVAALRRASSADMDLPMRLLDAGAHPADVVAPAIALAMGEEGAGRLILVLDDFQAVTAPPTLAIVDRLVEHLPDRARLVVVSRVRPALRLARHIVAGTASVVGADVLLFRGAEAELFLNGVLDLGLTARHLSAVQEATEGWAAGLVLAAHALTDDRDRDTAVQALARPSERVRRYVEEEVLDGIEPRMRRFLRETSILPRMDAALCAAVTRDPQAHDLLADAQDLNLFLTPAREGNGWVRYHPQFAAVLQEQLVREDPGVDDVYRIRAARWLEERGRFKEAIEHASRAGDGRRAGALMLRVETELLSTGRYTVLRRILDGLPAGLGRYEPLCIGLNAHSRLLEGVDPAVLEPVWTSLQPHRDAPGVARLLDHALIWPFYGRMTRSLEAGRRAYETYRAESPALWHSMAAMYGFALCFDGRVPEARALLERHLEEIVRTRSRIWALAALSFCTAKQGDHHVAVEHGRQAVALVARTDGQNAVVCSVAYQALAHALNGQGQQAEAAEAIALAAETTATLPQSLYHALTLAVRAKIRIALRDRAAARADLVEARTIVDRFPDAAAFSATVAAVEAEAGQGGVDLTPGTVPTPAELRLLELLPSEDPLPVLAGQLRISRNTAKTHARRLYRRLGVQTREDAIRVARDRGFL
jgi:LuxR family maltose regulon positive regulatory protein